MTEFWVRVAAVTLLNGLVATAVMCLEWRGGRVRRRRTELRHMLMALAALVLLGLIERVALRGFGFNFFGLVRLVYVQFVALIPALGVVVIVQRLLHGRRGRGPMASRAAMGVALLTLPLAPLGAYASLIEPYWLSVERVTIAVPTMPTGAEPIRVGILADIQTERVTDWERRAVAALMAESPELILITGDILQLDDQTFAAREPAMRELLGTLSAPAGVFAVEGDCDPRGRTRRLYLGTGVKYLVNDIAETTCRGQRILIGGCERDFEAPKSRWMLGQLAARGGDGAIRIVAAHDPSVVRLVADSDAADLVVAGHTHGGQVRLPWIGPLITATTLPRANCAGLSVYEGLPLYVSRGVGMVRDQAPPVRLGCRPEVSVIELRGRGVERLTVGGEEPAR
jgi:predicted MPP superfamily phosphohydrolase